MVLEQKEFVNENNEISDPIFEEVKKAFNELTVKLVEYTQLGHYSQPLCHETRNRQEKEIKELENTEIHNLRAFDNKKYFVFQNPKEDFFVYCSDNKKAFQIPDCDEVDDVKNGTITIRNTKGKWQDRQITDWGISNSTERWYGMDSFYLTDPGKYEFNINGVEIKLYSNERCEYYKKGTRRRIALDKCLEQNPLSEKGVSLCTIKENVLYRLVIEQERDIFLVKYIHLDKYGVHSVLESYDIVKNFPNCNYVVGHCGFLKDEKEEWDIFEIREDGEIKQTYLPVKKGVQGLSIWAPEVYNIVGEFVVYGANKGDEYYQGLGTIDKKYEIVKYDDYHREKTKIEIDPSGTSFRVNGGEWKNLYEALVSKMIQDNKKEFNAILGQMKQVLKEYANDPDFSNKVLNAFSYMIIEGMKEDNDVNQIEEENKD